MKFIVAVGTLAFGYTLLYYGVSLFRKYDPRTATYGPDNDVPPLSYLLGFHQNIVTGPDVTNLKKLSPHPPFTKVTS